MRQGRSARWALRRIDAYRSSGAAHAHRGACRFEPSCSHFGEESFRTRAFPVAVALTTWRIIRCNPMTRGGHDPVDRSERFRPRRNAMATAVVAASFAGLAVIVGTQLAYAQSLDGGCTATINGHDPKGLTKSDPLVVHKGERVSVNGVVPPSVASLPANQITSNTKIKVLFIEGVVEPSDTQKPGTGPDWGGSVNVDDYLKYGVGLYKIEGSSSGNPGWSCTGSGYVKLSDGSPLSKPIGQGATALFAVAGLGALASSRTKRTPDPSITQHSLADDIRNDLGPSADDPAPAPAAAPPPSPVDKWIDDKAASGISALGCLIAVFALLFGIALGAGGGFSTIVPPHAPTSKRRVWVRGHPILGFVSGIFLGLALTVLAQQFALWPFTIWTVMAFPIIVAILCAVRAWIGKPYKLVAETAAVL